MNLDELFLSLGLGDIRDDVLEERVRVENPILERDCYHAKGARTMYILFPPWHTNRLIYYSIKQKLRKQGHPLPHRKTICQ